MAIGSVFRHLGLRWRIGRFDYALWLCLLIIMDLHRTVAGGIVMLGSIAGTTRRLIVSSTPIEPLATPTNLVD